MRGLLVVEGAHDCAFFGKIFEDKGFRRVQRVGDLAEFWHPLVPSKFPTDPGGRLDRVIRFPEFYVQGQNSIALSNAGGDTRLIETLRIPLEVMDVSDFDAIGVAFDADYDQSCERRFQWIIGELQRLNQEEVADQVAGFPLTLPLAPGSVIGGPPKFGVHIFPDNQSPGTLETVLLDLASEAHQVSHDAAHEFAKNVDSNCAGSPFSKKFKSPSGFDKARAGAIGSIAKPGHSLAVALQQSSWLTPQTLTRPSASSAVAFVEALFL